MDTYTGKVAFQGVAIGRILELKKESNVVRRKHIEDIEAEIEQITRAQEEAKHQLEHLYDKA